MERLEPASPTPARGRGTISLQTALLGTLVVFSIVLVLMLALQRRREYLFARVNELEAEISRVDAEIRRAEAEDALYRGGLIKALIGVRLATLKQTRAMLQQKADAGVFGIALSYTVDGRPSVSPARNARDAEGVRKELQALKEQIRLQEAEVNSYSGGLIQAIAASTLATMRQTEALLAQREIALRYDIPSYVSSHQRDTVVEAAPPEAGAATLLPNATESPQETVARFTRELDVTPSPPASSNLAGSPAGRPETPIFKVVAIETRITEANSAYSRFAWRLTIKNFDAKPHLFDATIEFQDAGGFIVDSDNEYDMVVPAFGEKTFTDFDLVGSDVRDKVARTEAKVRLKQ